MQAVHHHVRQRILKAPAGAVFVPMDFLDLAGRAAIDQALSRMVRAGTLARLARGLYHVPRINAALGVAVPPGPDQIAQAIGRRTNSRVVASEAVIANRAGLTTQVPAQPVYLTDGRSRTVAIGKRVFRFRHVSPKRLPQGDAAVAHAMQIVQYAIDHDVADKVLTLLAEALTRTQRSALLRQARYTDAKTVAIARQLVNAPKGPARG
jgi:predicted transcriptional regulator of viral defense system